VQESEPAEPAFEAAGAESVRDTGRENEAAEGGSSGTESSDEDGATGAAYELLDEVDAICRETGRALTPTGASGSDEDEADEAAFLEAKLP
jgi:hypothetical protein